ncbi:MAG: hypothetical protein U0263_14880 [Polyangiaceae bacterium]
MTSSPKTPWFALTLGVALAALSAACSGGERPTPYTLPSQVTPGDDAGTEDDGGNLPDAATGPCATGTTKTCTVNLPKHEGIKSCFKGVQLCVEGTWSECGDDEDLFEKYYGDKKGND